MAAGSRKFMVRLAALTGGALAVRMAFVIAARRRQILGITDVFWYHELGHLLATGHGWINPFGWAYFGRAERSAGQPPLFSLFLAGLEKLGIDTPYGQRLATCVVGAAAVAAIGLLARRLAGDRAGLIAAAAAAAYPMLWINDGALMPESLDALLVAIGLLLCYSLWRNPTWWVAGLMGGVFGLSALTRTESVFLFPLVALPLVLLLRNVSLRRRLGLLGAVAGAGVLVLGPWVGYNLSRFDEPALIKTGIGHVVAIGNCDATYSGTWLGYWNSSCALKIWPKGDESVVDVAARRKGIRYIKTHLSEQPKVVAARVGRMFGLYRPLQGVRLDQGFERRGYQPSLWGLISYYLLGAASIGGLVVLRRRKVTIAPFIGVTVMIAITAAASFGITRYRVPVDVFLPALAAVAIDAWWRRLRPTGAEQAALSTDTPGRPGSVSADADLTPHEELEPARGVTPR